MSPLIKVSLGVYNCLTERGEKVANQPYFKVWRFCCVVWCLCMGHMYITTKNIIYWFLRSKKYKIHQNLEIDQLVNDTKEICWYAYT